MSSAAISQNNYWLNRFAWAATAATWLLIGMGGLVTSHGAGLAVPDWPTSYGYNMFLFPVRLWRGGIFYEHTHRLAASLIGLLTFALAVWLWRREARRWMRWLGVAAFATVVLQGVLGGIRVTLLKDQIGIVHATLAQLFLGLLAAIACFTSGWWQRLRTGASRLPAASSAPRWAFFATLLVFLQLILGATMRHQHAGLAIPDFPLAYGRVWPTVDAHSLAQINQTRIEVTAVKPITAAQIYLQMAHRLAALLAIAAIACAAWQVRRDLGAANCWPRVAYGWLALSLAQVLLGALTIWSHKAADVATAHVVLGALLFATGVVLSLVLFGLPRPWTASAVPISKSCLRRARRRQIMNLTPEKALSDASALSDAQPARRSWTAIFADLLKARLTSLVLLTTGVGFYLGSSGAIDGLSLLQTLWGTALVAGGAAALNQYWERDSDARMQRTQQRPLPAGHLRPETALALGVTLTAAGLLFLALFVNALTSLLGAITFFIYLFVYTPLKRITPLNTIIGAIPGALPPLMGWTAARGELASAGWSLFAILFFWQLPHFMAIAWLYREDYARAGFAMLPVLDPAGARTGQLAVGHVLGLLPASLAPALVGLAGTGYAIGAVALGALFLRAACQFARQLSPARARRLFYMSLVYLPLLLALLVLDKIRL